MSEFSNLKEIQSDQHKFLIVENKFMKNNSKRYKTEINYREIEETITLIIGTLIISNDFYESYPGIFVELLNYNLKIIETPKRSFFPYIVFHIDFHRSTIILR